MRKFVPRRYQSFPSPEGEVILPPALPLPPTPNPLPNHPSVSLLQAWLVVYFFKEDGRANVFLRLTRGVLYLQLLFGPPYPQSYSPKTSGPRVALQDDPGSWQQQALVTALEQTSARTLALLASMTTRLDQFKAPIPLSLPLPPMPRNPIKAPPLSSFRLVIANLTLHWVTSWDLCQAKRLWLEGQPFQG